LRGLPEVRRPLSVGLGDMVEGFAGLQMVNCHQKSTFPSVKWSFLAIK
jgi:hypothetical protein